MKFKSYFIAPFIFQATIWRIIMRPFFYYFGRLQVSGLENLHGIKGPVIFAANHPSEIDAIILPLALPLWSRFMPLFYVVREPKYYQDPYFKWRRFLYLGWVFKLLGAFPIRSGAHDYALSLKNHVQILNDGGSICIFPEGVLSRGGVIGEAHGGVGYLALATGATVVPVYFGGMDTVSGKSFFSRTSSFRTLIGAPLTAVDVLPADLEPASIEACKTVAAAVLARVQQMQHAGSRQPAVQTQKYTYRI